MIPYEIGIPFCIIFLFIVNLICWQIYKDLKGEKSWFSEWRKRHTSLPYEPKPRFPGGLRIAYESSARKPKRRKA